MTREIKRGDIFECWNTEDTNGTFFMVTKVEGDSITRLWNDGYMPRIVTEPRSWIEQLGRLGSFTEEETQKWEKLFPDK